MRDATANRLVVSRGLFSPSQLAAIQRRVYVPLGVDLRDAKTQEPGAGFCEFEPLSFPLDDRDPRVSTLQRFSLERPSRTRFGRSPFGSRSRPVGQPEKNEGEWDQRNRLVFYDSKVVRRVDEIEFVPLDRAVNRSRFVRVVI